MSSPAIQYSADVGHAGREAFASLSDIAVHTFDGFERLARLNLQTMKTSLAEQHGIALEAVDSRSFDWILTLPTATAQAGFKKALAYWQHVCDIATETAANNAGAGWESFTECTGWLSSAWLNAARARAATPLILSAPDASLASAAEADATSAKGGKKRSVDIVDSSGHIVSSVKQ